MVPSKQKSKQIIKLYGYQKVAFKKLVLALRSTFRALLVMATGLGKTFLSIEVVKEFITPKDKVLFLCHENGILNKAYKDYQKYFGNQYSYAKFYGTDKDWEADKHNFVFATFQSVLGHLGNAKQKKKLFSKKHFRFVVVDEGHHAQAETFAEVINYFTPKYILGMTATPDREDQMDIRDIFGEAVVDIRLPEAIANNWLTKVEYKVLSDGLDEEKIRAVCNEVMIDNVRLTENQINEKIFIKARTEEQLEIVQIYSQTQKAIVFCENIEHLNHVASILPSSVCIHSKQSSNINDANFELFENGHVRHVIVVDKFNEGIDIPDTGLLVFLRATESERIFLQQLGRGLRKVEGKKKVVVLDFVGNINRIKQISNFVNEIEEISKSKNNKTTTAESMHVDGAGFSFDFSNQIVNLLDAFERINEDLYPTWQEASVAAQELSIGKKESKLQEDYRLKYKQDSRLPSSPSAFYRDFPGYAVFLGKDKYPTWQEASVAALKLGIGNDEFNLAKDYFSKYKKDSRLPYAPSGYYEDFPGWQIFLGKVKYPTWQEASAVAQKIGIGKDSRDLKKDYLSKYKQDLRLPSAPEKFYKDFPGYGVFLGREKYPTWQEASVAALKLGIGNDEFNLLKDYVLKYKQDLRLPGNPDNSYEDFPGWPVFLGKDKYPTWQEASVAALKLKIGKSAGNLKEDYQSKYKQDPRLPSTPNQYYKDFPGFKKFLGKK